MVDGIVYRYRTGIAWRDLPEAFGPWQTVRKWHHRMATGGIWDRVHANLTAAADAAGLVDWSLSVDSTPAPDDQRGHRKRRGSRGDRPVALDAADSKNRNVIERQHCHLRQWRGLATRCDKHAIIYLAAVIAWTRTLSDTPS